MKSRVADEVRAAHEADVMAMTPEERVALSFRLGEQALQDYMQTHGVTRDEALRVFRRARRAGRRYSRCIEELDEGGASR